MLPNFIKLSAHKQGTSVAVQPARIVQLVAGDDEGEAVTIVLLSTGSRMFVKESIDDVHDLSGLRMLAYDCESREYRELVSINHIVRIYGDCDPQCAVIELSTGDHVFSQETASDLLARTIRTLTE